MASGVIDLGVDGKLTGRIVWSSSSQGPAANASTVTATIQAARTDAYGPTTGTFSGALEIYNSGEVGFDAYESVNDDWVDLYSFSKTVPHNSDGTGSCYIYGIIYGPSGTSMGGRVVAGDATVTLDRIPRYTSITSFSVSKRNETSVTYNFSTADICDYAEYSTNNGSSWTGVDIADGKSGSFNVTGLSPNTTYNFKLRVRRKDSQLKTESSTVQQTTYKVPTQSLSSKTETSITMAWSVDSTADYIWYSKDNGSNWTAVGSVNATSGSYTISGLTANTAYNIKTRVRRKAPQTTYDTAASSQTTYNYPYVSAIGSNPLVIGNSQTLTLYNPLSRSVTVRMYQNSASGTQLYSGTTNSTSITFTPTASTLYESIPNSTDSNCVYSVIYGSSTKTTGTYKYQIVGNETPTFSNFTYADTNSTTTALTGNNQIIVNGYSNVTATISTANKAVAKNSATMNNYTLSIGNQSAQANYSASSDVSMSLTKVNSGAIKVTANDSRGLGTPVTKNATIKNYVKPATTNLTATRSNNGVGETVTLSFAGTWWNDSFGSVANSIQNIAYYFKKSTASAWTTGTTTITFSTSGNNFSGSLAIAGDTSSQGFAAADSYYIKIVVTDRLDHSVEYQTTIGSGTPAIAIYKDKVAIGKQYDTNIGGRIQINGQTKISGTAGEKPLMIRGIVGSTSDNSAIEGLYLQYGANQPVYFGNDATYSISADGSYYNGKANTSNSATTSSSCSGNSATATKATQDSGGTNIITGYAHAGAPEESSVFNNVGSGKKLQRSGLYSANDGSWYNLINVRHRNGEGDGTNYGMQIISSLTTANAVLQMRKQTNGSWTSWEQLYRCKNLYNNTSGTTGNITLSETAANFTYIEIYGFDATSSTYFSTKYYSPNDKTVSFGYLQQINQNDFIRLSTKRISISGTTLTSSNQSVVHIYTGVINAHSSSSDIKIVRVDGYR